MSKEVRVSSNIFLRGGRFKGYLLRSGCAVVAIEDATLYAYDVKTLDRLAEAVADARAALESDGGVAGGGVQDS